MAAVRSNISGLNFGVAIFPTDSIHDPPELARLVEDRGFESLLFPDHTHIPSKRETPFPDGGDLPAEYSRIYDPFVALGAAATATSRLRLGTGICLVVERDPIITAKQVASLDCISGGRVLFGIGAGWNAEEMRNHRTDPARRFGIMRERVEAMKAIWAEDEATYAGRHVAFDRIWSWPKPVQHPHPPILVGGNGPKVIDRVVAYGDEWFPEWLDDGGADNEMVTRINRLRARCVEAGRPVAPVTLAGRTRDPERIERLERAGVHRVLVWLPSDGRDAVERALDEYARSIDGYERAGS